MQAKRLIVFDMDGVVVDVSDSYRETVRRTARAFFQGARGADLLPDPLFSLSELARVKQSGGLNNDWDLTCRTLELLWPFVKMPQVAYNPAPWLRYTETIARCDVADLARHLKSEARPLTLLLNRTGLGDDDFVRSCYQGDVGSGNLIKQLFQEIYLGSDRFESIYGQPAKDRQREGLIHREKLLIDSTVFDNLARHSILAIATGRPGAEADFPLDKFGLRPYFGPVYTLDDCLREEERMLAEEGRRVSLSKPHPFMLDAIAAGAPGTFTQRFYVGDMPDDMIAAARSRFGFHGVGLILAAPDKAGLKEALFKAGARFVAETPAELQAILESAPP
ncbi:MAG: hypothetical protein MUP74_01845 [Desulfobacterales bacterium]|nr:hypothetical protein [Desulfobacterales bacterium]